jgi:hypothetical protein
VPINLPPVRVCRRHRVTHLSGSNIWVIGLLSFSLQATDISSNMPPVQPAMGARPKRLGEQAGYCVAGLIKASYGT